MRMNGGVLIGSLKVSPGNSKMGAIPSVSLPAGATCRKGCACYQKCYARKLERLRPSVRNAYQSNYELLLSDPTTYWREVEASVMMSRFFRFHVSGDMPDADYLRRMVGVAERNPQCEILCFTKKYELVNGFLDSGGRLPENLHMIFSAWEGMEMQNPHRLPEAHVRFRSGSTTARSDAVFCGGNCTECALTDSGCWKLGRGEQVVFNEH